MFLNILLWSILNKFKSKQNIIKKLYIPITSLNQLSTYDKSCLIYTPNTTLVTNSPMKQIPEDLLLHPQIHRYILLLDKDSFKNITILSKS